MSHTSPHNKLILRRTLLFLGSVLLLYPLFRFVRFRLPKKPKIVEISGSIKKDGYLARDEFILFSRQEKLWAVSRVCTHLGCRVNFKEQEGVLECPCHQSRFSVHGEVIRGPAERNLALHPVRQQASPPTLVITIQ